MKFFLSKLFATFFFVGLIKKAPGTFGTLAGAIAIFPFFATISFLDFQYLIYSFFVLGTIATKIYMNYTKREDPKEVVIDEVLGIWITLAICKFYLNDYSIWQIFLYSILLFRFFDILKPFPISLADKKIKNAFGVMFDDILAGLFAGVIIVFVAKFFL
jgi:phosphatidylglycerophosphatase A